MVGLCLLSCFGSNSTAGGVLFMWDRRVVEKINMDIGWFSVSCLFRNVDKD